VVLIALVSIPFARAEVAQAPTEERVEQIVSATPITPQIYLETKLKEAGLEGDYPLLYKVISCESGWKAEAVNYNSNGTIDRGLFQINSVHGYGNELFDPYTNIDIGLKLYMGDGIGHWTASKGCWHNG